MPLLLYHGANDFDNAFWLFFAIKQIQLSLTAYQNCDIICKDIPKNLGVNI